MPYDAALADGMRRELAGRRDVAEKKMFGGICWMLNDHMLCGVEVGRYMFRVGPDQEADALARPGASPMDITGRPMRGFVWVNAAEATDNQLTRWVEMAARYVGGLPPK